MVVMVVSVPSWFVLLGRWLSGVFRSFLCFLVFGEEMEDGEGGGEEGRRLCFFFWAQMALFLCSCVLRCRMNR